MPVMAANAGINYSHSGEAGTFPVISSDREKSGFPAVIPAKAGIQ